MGPVVGEVVARVVGRVEERRVVGRVVVDRVVGTVVAKGTEPGRVAPTEGPMS